LKNRQQFARRAEDDIGLAAASSLGQVPRELQCVSNALIRVNEQRFAGQNFAIPKGSRAGPQAGLGEMSACLVTGPSSFSIANEKTGRGAIEFRDGEGRLSLDGLLKRLDGGRELMASSQRHAEIIPCFPAIRGQANGLSGPLFGEREFAAMFIEVTEIAPDAMISGEERGNAFIRFRGASPFLALNQEKAKLKEGLQVVRGQPNRSLKAGKGLRPPALMLKLAPVPQQSVPIRNGHTNSLPGEPCKPRRTKSRQGNGL
jgi:hypothetical protein